MAHNELLVIVRHVGERTLDLCAEALRRQTDAEIALISATPFAETVRQCFEAGREAGAKWTLCIDADVVPAETCVSDLVAMAEKGPEQLFEAQGLILDKIFGVRRPAGNHIYRTSLFDKALDLLPASGTSLRPESDTLWQMVRAGHGWVQGDALVGLHDYGQTHADIARKVIVQYHKFEARRAYMRSRFAAEADADDDFRVALSACDVAAAYDDAPQVDAALLAEASAKALAPLALPEKGPVTEAEQLAYGALLADWHGQPLTENDRSYIGPFTYHGQG